MGFTAYARGGHAGVEKIDLAEEAADAEPAEQHLAFLRQPPDMHHAATDDVKGAVGRAAFDDAFFGFDLALAEQRGKRAQFIVGQLAQDRNGAE